MKRIAMLLIPIVGMAFIAQADMALPDDPNARPFMNVPLPSPAPAAHPEGRNALDEVQGRVEAIDRQSRQLRIRRPDNRRVDVRVDPDTRIMNDKNQQLTLSWLQRNDPVIVYYNPADGTARQVDLQPTLAEILLGQ